MISGIEKYIWKRVPSSTSRNMSILAICDRGLVFISYPITRRGENDDDHFRSTVEMTSYRNQWHTPFNITSVPTGSCCTGKHPCLVDKQKNENWSAHKKRSQYVSRREVSCIPNYLGLGPVHGAFKTPSPLFGTQVVLYYRMKYDLLKRSSSFLGTVLMKLDMLRSIVKLSYRRVSLPQTGRMTDALVNFWSCDGNYNEFPKAFFSNKFCLCSVLAQLSD